MQRTRRDEQCTVSKCAHNAYFGTSKHHPALVSDQHAARSLLSAQGLLPVVDQTTLHHTNLCLSFYESVL
jgi:hypothetical protein